MLAVICSVLLMGSGAAGYAVFIEPCWIEVAEYEMTSENLPDAFDGKKIALITDTHHGTRRSYNLLEKLVKMTQDQSPDLILLGGDYSRERSDALAECFESLAELEAPLGVYAVLGNHDYWNSPLMRETIRNAGIELLQNNSLWLEEGDDRILLAGVTDIWCAAPSLAGMQQELQESDFTILLSHNPDFFDELSETEQECVDLMLSGHTHGGQVTAFGFYAPRKTAKAEYISGRVKPNSDGRATVIVSNGVGTTSLPIRFFARPQIVLVTLKKTLQN